jgi:uncharacterized protein (DUF2132 family)
MENNKNNPLQNKTLKMILESLVAEYGWEDLGDRFRMKCFLYDPTIGSSLTFLRKTPWARKKIEDFYVYSEWKAEKKRQKLQKINHE